MPRFSVFYFSKRVVQSFFWPGEGEGSELCLWKKNQISKNRSNNTHNLNRVIAYCEKHAGESGEPRDAQSFKP